MTEKPNLDGEPVAVRSLYPEGEAYDKSSMRLYERQRDRVEAVVADTDVIVVSDTDLDGLGAATFVHAAHGSDRVGHVPASHDQRVPVWQTIDLVADHAGATERIYICDLPPNKPGKYAGAVTKAASEAEVVICDHHDTWDDEVRRQCAHADLHIGDGISAAEVTFDAVPDLDADGWAEFAALVTDHDVGKDDEEAESTFLADYADATSVDEFVAEAVAAEGSPAWGEAAQKTVAEYREEKDRLIDLAVRRATVHGTLAGNRIVTTYGRGPASQTWERIEDEYDADVFVFVKPGDKLNVRSRESVPVARDIARMFWGGGHDCEAGAKPGFYGSPPKADFSVRNSEIYTDPIRWGDHWATMGREARERAVRAAEIVFEED